MGGGVALAANIGIPATSSASVSPFLVIRMVVPTPHLLDRAAIAGTFEMGPFSFFLLVIATFTLSSAALLLGWMVTERKPKRSASAAHGDPSHRRDLGAYTHRP